MSKPPKKRILQVIPALPGYWALYSEAEDKAVQASLPVVCWVLTEDDTGFQDVEARVMGHYGDTDYAESKSDFIGLGYFADGKQPPNPWTVFFSGGDKGRVDELKAGEVVD
jgi:hypothetical protein